MWKMRFSIAGLMGFVLVAALGFGGLKERQSNTGRADVSR